MDTWFPSQPNGWYPKLSPTGAHVLYGFWQTFVCDFATGIEVEVLAPVTAGLRPRLNPLGWLDAETFVCVSESPAAVYRVSLTDLKPVPVDAPGYIGMNFGSAANGHWGTCATSQTACIKDGEVFRADVHQYGCVVNGDNLVTAEPDNGYVLMHFVGDHLVRRLPADNRWTVDFEGDISAGYYGPVSVYPFSDKPVDATLTPWRAEEPGCLLRVDNALWLWNASVRPDTGEGLMMGRRVGETVPIQLRGFPSVATHVVWTGTEFRVAGSDDKGRAQVRSVAIDAVREPVLPAAVTFSFAHPVDIVPFKDPRKEAGTTYRMEDGSLGVYSEAEQAAAALAEAAKKKTRLLLAHDAPTAWAPPAGLRAWDIPFVELYRAKAETLAVSLARWIRQVQTLLQAWPNDCGVIPMFYCQGGAPPDELWTVQEVLDGLQHLSALVNLSPRIKVIAPFAYERANGITAHAELQQAFAALKAAAVPAVLVPIGGKKYPTAQVFHRSRFMTYLTLNGKFVGISPRPVPGASGDAQYPVYADRAAGGAWEQAEVAQAGDRFYVRYVESNRTLTLTPGGQLQSRVAGTQGAWEGFYATTQPDGINLLYRRDGNGLLIEPVLTIVEQ